MKETVQSAERTLVDKIYAIGDYYLSGNTLQHSRHIYSIYKLESIIKFDDELKKLAENVRDESAYATRAYLRTGAYARKMTRRF